jgi:hypothetical protein
VGQYRQSGAETSATSSRDPGGNTSPKPRADKAVNAPGKPHQAAHDRVAGLPKFTRGADQDAKAAMGNIAEESRKALQQVRKNFNDALENAGPRGLQQRLNESMDEGIATHPCRSNPLHLLRGRRRRWRRSLMEVYAVTV